MDCAEMEKEKEGGVMSLCLPVVVFPCRGRRGGVSD